MTPTSEAYNCDCMEYMRECLGVERVGDREVIHGSLFQ